MVTEETKKEAAKRFKAIQSRCNAIEQEHVGIRLQLAAIEKQLNNMYSTLDVAENNVILLKQDLNIFEQLLIEMELLT